MNKRLGGLLRPSVGLYLSLMAVFCGATLVVGQYWLAAAEAALTLIAFCIYVLQRNRRDQRLKKYLRSFPETVESVSQGANPFPTVVVRLADGGIVWTNHRFSSLTGISDTMMEHELGEVLPDFATDWLASGKTESPHDATIQDRRYRVYGTVIRAKDSRSTMLGVMYFCDLTELYQVRDEYIRSRPVVAIILIDNYEELIRNLSESGISTNGQRATAVCCGSWSAAGFCLSLKSGICPTPLRTSFPCWNPSMRLPTPPAWRPPFPWA